MGKMVVVRARRTWKISAKVLDAHERAGMDFTDTEILAVATKLAVHLVEWDYEVVDSIEDKYHG